VYKRARRTRHGEILPLGQNESEPVMPQHRTRPSVAPGGALRLAELL
jgi:hypothetical protein